MGKGIFVTSIFTIIIVLMIILGFIEHYYLNRKNIRKYFKKNNLYNNDTWIISSVNIEMFTIFISAITFVSFFDENKITTNNIIKMNLRYWYLLYFILFISAAGCITSALHNFHSIYNKAEFYLNKQNKIYRYRKQIQNLKNALNRKDMILNKLSSDKRHSININISNHNHKN